MGSNESFKLAVCYGGKQADLGEELGWSGKSMGRVRAASGVRNGQITLILGEFPPDCLPCREGRRVEKGQADQKSVGLLLANGARGQDIGETRRRQKQKPSTKFLSITLTIILFCVYTRDTNDESYCTHSCISIVL